MRTETDLRQALAGLADSAPDPTKVGIRLQLHTSALKPARPWWRPATVIIALCVAVVLVAVLIPLASRRAEPADLRKPGYWGFVSRIDPPSGWRLDEHGVQLDREYLRLAPTPERQDLAPCEVYIYGRGAYPLDPPVGTPATVGDRPGTFVEGNAVDPSMLVWSYSADAWALAFCTSEPPNADPDILVRIATAVRFEPSPVRLPIRLTKLPDTYFAAVVLEGTIDDTKTGAFRLDAPDRPSLSIFTTPTPFPAAGPGLPGVEEHTVNGRLVRLREDQRGAQLQIGDRYVTISSTGGDRQSWDPGEKEAILAVAASLRFAGDLTNPDTWFDAERTVPG